MISTFPSSCSSQIQYSVSMQNMAYLECCSRVNVGYVIVTSLHITLHDPELRGFKFPALAHAAPTVALPAVFIYQCLMSSCSIPTNTYQRLCVHISPSLLCPQGTSQVMILHQNHIIVLSRLDHVHPLLLWTTLVPLRIISGDDPALEPHHSVEQA